ncbi:hypothetical protein ACJ73_03797 [Blastomyces percursus]|uniref:Uncharacterized protein n=1 Tax=Blastomyces percursus TaxID=1658174 RepID=A0A1J9RAZ6_9EURO|nr:hypothetical protein ACJ73_03797 [Blastomyces percursus]
MRLFTPTWARKLYKPTAIWHLALISTVCQLPPGFCMFSTAHALHGRKIPQAGVPYKSEPPAPFDELSNKHRASKLSDVQQLLQRLPTSVQWANELDPKLPDDLDPSDPLMPYLDILFIVDRLIPPKTVFHFFEFACRGTLPNGKKTELPIISSEEIQLVASPYSEWALPPHNKITLPVSHMLMSRIGSDEDSGRLTVVEKPVHAMKVRLWEGIPPISEHQWRQKGLDKAENFNYACQYIEAVISAFDYLNAPLHISHMRETFNYMSDHLSEFDEALNNIRRRDGKEPNINSAGLWADFIRVKYEVMTDRAHLWVISHVDALREPLLNEIKAQGSYSDDNISPEQLDLVHQLRKLAGLAAEADYTIYMSTYGYKGSSGPSLERMGDWRNPVLEKRRQKYVNSYEYFQTINNLTDEMVANLAAYYTTECPVATPKKENDLLKAIQDQLRIQGQQRLRARSDPDPGPRAPPLWISDVTTRIREIKNLGQPPMTEVGFAIYRLSYGQNDDGGEWATLKEAIERDLASWGDGIDGVEDIKPFLKLKWFDGRELGLAEDDIDGAKRHFTTFLDTLTPSDGIDQSTILILDSASLASYAKPTPDDTDDIEDHYLLAVDAHYDPAEGIERPEESPGYVGSMRILTRLVWSELFALTYNQAMWLDELWPLAMGHPEQVYVGTTVGELMMRWAAAKVAGDNELKARFEAECKNRQEGKEVKAWSKTRREKEL